MAKQSTSRKKNAGIVVMLSGGPDSAILAAHLKSQGNNVRALFFDYGQVTASAELSSARAISIRLGISIDVVDISKIKNTFLGLSAVNEIGLGFGPDRPSPNCPHGLFGIAATFATLTGA